MTMGSTSAAYVRVYGWSAALKEQPWEVAVVDQPAGSGSGGAQGRGPTKRRTPSVVVGTAEGDAVAEPYDGPQTRGRPAPAARRRARHSGISAGSDLHVKSSVRLAEHEVQVPATWGRQIYSGRIVAGRGNGTWKALHNHCASPSHWARRDDEDPGGLKTADPQNLVLPYGASTRNKMRALPEEVGGETHCLWLGDGPIEAVQPGDPRCRRSRGSEERRRTTAARKGQRRGDG